MSASAMTKPAHFVSNVIAAAAFPYHVVFPLLRLDVKLEQAGLFALGLILSASLPDHIEFGVIPHRKVTHCILIPALMLLACHYVVQWQWKCLLAGSAVGYLAHLLCDLMDHGGVHLYPFSPSLGLRIYKTSGMFMWFGVIIWAIACGGLFVWLELPYWR